MKKIVALLLMVTSVFAVSARDTISRDANVLPVAAKMVLKGNFKAGISFIKIDKTLGIVNDYEVILDDGSEITFDKNGNWQDIEVRSNKSVPAGLVPAGITNYVKKNMKNVRIIGLEKNRGGYTADLSNGVEIKFDKNGNFVRFDD